MKWVGLVMMILNVTNCFAGVKAVLFDCDGTLVDSEYAHYLGWKRALNDYGSDLDLEKEYFQYVGKSPEVIANSLAEKVGSHCGEDLLARKRTYYRELCKSGLPPIEATVNFLKLLAVEKGSLGIKIGVCSASRKADILIHLEHLEIQHLLDIVLSGQEDLLEYTDPEGVNKPKPYIYLKAMKKLGVTADETVVIEDSASGTLAGASAGCFTIAVPNDYTKYHDFSHTHWQLDSFLDIDIEDFFQQISLIQVE